MFRVPMFGYGLLLFALLAVVLAIAVFLAFKSGEKGTTKLGGCAGCAIALALLLIAGMGALGLVIVSVVSLPDEAVRRGPVRKFELHWGEDRSAPAPSESGESVRSELAPGDAPTPAPAPGGAPAPSPLRLRLELRGMADASSVIRWLRPRVDEGTVIAVGEGRDEAGATFTTIDLTIPLDAHDRDELKRLRHDLERDLPDFKLPTGVTVELRGPGE